MPSQGMHVGNNKAVGTSFGLGDLTEPHAGMLIVFESPRHSMRS